MIYTPSAKLNTKTAEPSIMANSISKFVVFVLLGLFPLSVIRLWYKPVLSALTQMLLLLSCVIEDALYPAKYDNKIKVNAPNSGSSFKLSWIAEYT